MGMYHSSRNAATLLEPGLMVARGDTSEYDVRISDDPESPGFQVEKRNVGGCNWITAIDIESIQGQDFEWIYGQDQPVMGAPPARSPELGDEEEVKFSGNH